MAKRSLGIFAVAALMVVGCGTTSYSGIGTKIVGNNAAGYNAESKKQSTLFYGELDAEMLMRIKPATKTPDRPTAPQPIRPKPQSDTVEEDFSDDRSEVDAQTGHSATWLAHLDSVLTGRLDLTEQKAFLKQTPTFQIEEIHRMFDDEIDILSPASARIRETAWRNLTPASRLAQFKAKQREIADQWSQPVSGFDPLP